MLGGNPGAGPEHCRNYTSNLAWEYLGIPVEELETGADAKPICNPLFSLLIQNVDGWTDGYMDVQPKCQKIAKKTPKKHRFSNWICLINSVKYRLKK